MAGYSTRVMLLESFGQPLRLAEWPRGELRPGEVLLRLRASGICGSDLDIVGGRDPRVILPLVPGHEGIGEIVAIGGEKRDIFGQPLRIGDLVAFNRGLTCGHCPYCTIRQQPELCPERQTYGISLSPGCYAEIMILRAGTELIKLPPDADPVALVAATCSGATAAHAVELSDVEPGSVVVIIGPGALGLYAAAFALWRGAAHVVMIGTGRSQHRLTLAAEIGCETLSTAEMTADARKSHIMQRSTGYGAQAVIDCAGTAESLHEALTLVAPGGTIAMAGVATPQSVFSLDPYQLARQQIRWQGVWTSNVRHLYQALMLAQSKRFPLERLVTHVLPLAEANEGLRILRCREGIKIVLVP